MKSTKILLIIGLVLLTFITMVGGNPKHDAYGFRYWKHGDFIRAYWTTGSLGNFLGWWRVVLVCIFPIHSTSSLYECGLVPYLQSCAGSSSMSPAIRAYTV
jgi:amino acid permease